MVLSTRAENPICPRQSCCNVSILLKHLCIVKKVFWHNFSHSSRDSNSDSPLKSVKLIGLLARLQLKTSTAWNESYVVQCVSVLVCPYLAWICQGKSVIRSPFWTASVFSWLLSIPPASPLCRPCLPRVSASVVILASCIHFPEMNAQIELSKWTHRIA